MSTNQITLTQIGHYIGYCKLYNGAAFSDFLGCNDVTNSTPFTLWSDNDDWLYIGKSTTFAYVGFRVGTAGAGYGNFTFEYSCSGSYSITGVNQGTKTFTVAESAASKFTDGTHFTISGSTGNDGTYTCDGDATGSGPTDIVVNEAIPDATVDGTISTIWTVITAKHNSTSSFSQSGFIAWSIPGDWTTRTVDSQSAYWLRATQDEASPTTPATAYHLLENITLNPPLLISWPETRQRLRPDIVSNPRKIDLGFTGPSTCIIEGMHCSISMANLNLIWYWWDLRRLIHIKDEAQTTPLSFSNDSYIRTGKGRIDEMPWEAESVQKMEGKEFTIKFLVYEVTTLTSTLGLTS